MQLQVMDAPYCAKETRFVRAVCLPDQMFPAGKECVISGWGATETSKAFFPPILQNILKFKRILYDDGTALHGIFTVFCPPHVSDRYSSQLLNARVFLISEDRCKAPHVYGNVLDSSMFCAGTLQGGVDSCQVLVLIAVRC